MRRKVIGNQFARRKEFWQDSDLIPFLSATAKWRSKKSIAFIQSLILLFPSNCFCSCEFAWNVHAEVTVNQLESVDFNGILSHPVETDAEDGKIDKFRRELSTVGREIVSTINSHLHKDSRGFLCGNLERDTNLICWIVQSCYRLWLYSGFNEIFPRRFCIHQKVARFMRPRNSNRNQATIYIFMSHEETDCSAFYRARFVDFIY